MEMNIFYLHPCARVCAEWLHDKHTAKQQEEVGMLLSYAVQLQLCERLPDLVITDCPEHPWLSWTLHSIDHVTWLHSYYVALTDKLQHVFHREDRRWKFMLTIERHLVRFPRNGWTDPPQIVPEDCNCPKVTDGYRSYYSKCKIKVGSYKRVRVPYWARDFMLDYSPD